MTNDPTETATAKARRRAEMIRLPNVIKQKVGSGGLDEKVLQKAQKVIDESDVDFVPIGQRYLTALHEAMKMTQSKRGMIEDETLITTMLYPAMQLKANGGMFGYPLVTSVAARLIRFLEHLREPNEDALEVIRGFYDSIQAIMLMGEGASEVAEHSDDIYVALDDACRRYFEKYEY